MKSGDFQPTNFASTQAGIQAALDYAGVQGEVYIGPGTYTGITNLTMYAKCKLRGAGPLVTILQRSASATGTMLRDKSTAEGNSSEATGIQVTDIQLSANGSAGDGINFGTQGVHSFNSAALLSDVYVNGFTSGTGITLQANAVHSRNVWSIGNGTGFLFTGGGANHWDGFWSEANSTAQVVMTASPYNVFTMLQLEDNGTVATNQIDLQANSSNNQFFGLYMALSGNGTNLVRVRSGAVCNCFYGITVASNGFTWTNTIYTDGTAVGSGSKAFMPFWVDTSNTVTGYYHNQSTGTTSSIVGTKFSPSSCDVAGALTVTGTTQLTGNVTAGAAGSGFLATFGQGNADATSGTLTLRSGGGEAVLLFDESGTSRAKLFMTASANFFDTRSGGGITFRNGIAGSNYLVCTSAGNLSCAGSMTVGNLTSGKYPKISTAGLLIDGPTPLAGTKVYYVSDTSGGAVTRKLTFVDGILTAET